MVSGYYKYIVFERLERSTGKVYDEPCHRLMGHAVDLPNTDWVAENHWCAPLYYRPADVAAELQAVSGSWHEGSRHRRRRVHRLARRRQARGPQATRRGSST